MPTQRIHPDKYLPDYYTTMERAVEVGMVELYYMNADAAHTERMNFYGARAALKKFPEHNIELAEQCSNLMFKLDGSKLIIKLK